MKPSITKKRGQAKTACAAWGDWTRMGRKCSAILISAGNCAAPTINHARSEVDVVECAAALVAQKKNRTRDTNRTNERTETEWRGERQHDVTGAVDCLLQRTDGLTALHVARPLITMYVRRPSTHFKDCVASSFYRSASRRCQRACITLVQSWQANCCCCCGRRWETETRRRHMHRTHTHTHTHTDGLNSGLLPGISVMQISGSVFTVCLRFCNAYCAAGPPGLCTKSHGFLLPYIDSWVTKATYIVKSPANAAGAVSRSRLLLVSFCVQRRRHY